MDRDAGVLAQDKQNLTHYIPDKQSSKILLWNNFLSFGSSCSFHEKNAVVQECENVMPMQHEPSPRWISPVKRNPQRTNQLDNSDFF